MNKKRFSSKQIFFGIIEKYYKIISLNSSGKSLSISKRKMCKLFTNSQLAGREAAICTIQFFIIFYFD